MASADVQGRRSVVVWADPETGESMVPLSVAENLAAALEWIRHQTGTATCDDAVRAMNDAYEAAANALAKYRAVNPMKAECKHPGAFTHMAERMYCPDCQQELPARTTEETG